VADDRVRQVERLRQRLRDAHGLQALELVDVAQSRVAVVVGARRRRFVHLVERRELRVDSDLVGIEHLAVDEQVEARAERRGEQLRSVGERRACRDAVVADREAGA
jgi:hypothetical protein